MANKRSGSKRKSYSEQRKQLRKEANGNHELTWAGGRRMYSHNWGKGIHGATKPLYKESEDLPDWMLECDPDT